MAKHESQGSQFSFQTFFQEAQKDLPFHQKPEPHVSALRVEREDEPQRGGEAKRDDDAANDQPAWRRLPAWVYIVAWIATSSAVILQVRRIVVSPCCPRWCRRNTRLQMLTLWPPSRRTSTSCPTWASGILSCVAAPVQGKLGRGGWS